MDVEETAHNAINARLLDDYYKDAAGGVGRWNKLIKNAGIDFTLNMPFKGFNRKIGTFADDFITPEGEVVSEDEWISKQHEWFCDDADGEYIQSLMVACTEAGQYAGWIAPPRIGINNQPTDYELSLIHI